MEVYPLFECQAHNVVKHVRYGGTSNIRLCINESGAKREKKAIAVVKEKGKEE